MIIWIILTLLEKILIFTFENDTFESVNIESVRVDRHPHRSISPLALKMKLTVNKYQ